jgi:AcrR family transcriptional regulator
MTRAVEFTGEGIMGPDFSVERRSFSRAASGRTDDRDTCRDDLIAAMVQTVGRRGYLAATVAEVLAQAKSCPATFYGVFANKQECFLAAHETAVEQALGAVVSDCDGELPWLDRVTRGLETLIGFFATNPELARVVMVEVQMAGVDGYRRHLNAVARFGELIAAGFEPPFEAGPPANTALMSASGVAALIAEHLVIDCSEQLPGLLPDLKFALLVPYIGPRAASEEMSRVHGDGVGGSRPQALSQAPPPFG